MYYSGIGSEAGVSIDQQVRAIVELGWNHMDLRNIDNVNITDISDGQFDEIVEMLSSAGISVSCFASNVAGWGKDALNPRDFELSLEELDRAIPRMHRLGTKMIRGMSFKTPKEDRYITKELENQLLGRMRTILRRCEEAGILFVLENCVCYFTQSYEHMDRMRENIESPAFKVVFDPCNPLMTDNRMGRKPYKKQIPWEAYSHLKDLIIYVHIKDGRFVRDTGGIFPEVDYTYPGEGDADIKRIVSDLFISGYDGGFCIEPHISNPCCDKTEDPENEELLRFQFDSFVDYGRRTQELIESIHNSGHQA
jgi:sugar phosphate isomerase/epimerase